MGQVIVVLMFVQAALIRYMAREGPCLSCLNGGSNGANGAAPPAGCDCAVSFKESNLAWCLMGVDDGHDNIDEVDDDNEGSGSGTLSLSCLWEIQW